MPGSIIDTNIYLSRWPFRRLPLDDTTALVAKLRANGVTQAWAGSFDGLLHKDLGGVNRRLVEACRQHGENILIPFGSINPKLPDWEEELRRCHEDYHLPGLRLHPNYHGYTLDDPAFAKLLSLAEKRGLIVQLALCMEDERTLHPLVQVPAVNTQPLISLLKNYPQLRLQILNGFRTLRAEPLLKLMAAGQVYFEIAMLEGVDGIANLLKQIPLDRLLFGSYAPFFYFEAALLKVKESPLTDEQAKALQQLNAERLRAKS